MKIDLFAKHRTGESQNTGEKYDFYNYTARLTKKDGEVIAVTVKFADCDPPKGKNCPCTLVIPKKSANLVVDHYDRLDNEGNVTEVCTKYILWVKEYTVEEYVDHSLDDFVD